jgi:hypothetical protein
MMGAEDAVWESWVEKKAAVDDSWNFVVGTCDKSLDKSFMERKQRHKEPSILGQGQGRYGPTPFCATAPITSGLD